MAATGAATGTATGAMTDEATSADEAAETDAAEMETVAEEDVEIEVKVKGERASTGATELIDCDELLSWATLRVRTFSWASSDRARDNCARLAGI